NDHFRKYLLSTVVLLILLKVDITEIPVFKRAEGETITVKCHFSTTARKKYFCKDECEDDDILIKTDKNRAQSGRYSISFENRGRVLSVTIKQLIKSDSGLYRCGLDIALSIDPYSEFRIIVTNGELLLTNMKM
uniref:Immunoglobulin V-set domain-containing protein n=1 Tax=Lates calcarifer TaxID=8187 RepID=A0A4W6FBL2_LATCA